MIRIICENINDVVDSNMTIAYMRNLDTHTANYGSTYGQNLEPAGEYMIMDTMYNAPNRYTIPKYEYGFITFKKPLILDFIDTTDKGWKKTLSDMYNGKTGKRLSNAIKKDGYDGIVTVSNYGVEEIVNLCGNKKDTYITENTNKTNVKIIDNVLDAAKTEIYGTIVAYIDKEPVGTVDYTVEQTNKIFYIRMINVVPEYRRQGIATQLCSYIKDNYSDYSVDWGYTTADGEQLKKKLTKDVPNKEYQQLKQKILILQKRLDEIESIVNTDNDDAFEKMRQDGLIDKYGDEWNELYDKQREYLNQISDMEPYKTIWN